MKTLTAVAALTLAAGGAMAQDTSSVPLQTPDAVKIETPAEGTTYVVNPDGSRETLTADEAGEDEADAAENEADDADTAAEDDSDEDQAAADDASEDEAADETSDDAAAGEDEATDEGDADDASMDEADEAEDDNISAAEEDESEDGAEEDAADEGGADEEEASDTDAADESDDEGEDAAGDAAADDGDSEDEVVAAADVDDEDEAPFVQQIVDVDFSFEGPFGRYDSLQLQRGLQVYTEVCAACHGLKYVPLRTLGDATGPNLPEDQVRAYAAEFDIYNPELDEDVPREPTDHFPSVDPVDGMGPDLSLMAKARAGFGGPYGTGINQLFKGMGGPEYIYSILTGYTGETKEEAGTTLYENLAFPGGWISMAPPLDDDYLDFEDGHPNDLASIAKEVSAFLMWTAEPKMMQRKTMGTVAVIFLLVLTALLYLTNRRLWSRQKPTRQDS